MKYKSRAGVIFGFNRPEYLEPVLRHFEAAEESDDFPWYAYIDGAKNLISGTTYAKQEDIDKCVALLRNSTLPICKIVVNSDNYCIARQKHKAHKLYDEHDLLFFFEDDMLVGKHYLRLLRIALEQYPMHATIMNTHVNRGRLNVLRNCGIARVWGYGMSRKLYQNIKSEWDRFATGIAKVDYIQRSSIKGIKRRLGIRWKSHDITITRLCREYGDGKLWPDISRGFYVGRKGAIAYRTDRTWFKKRMDRQPKRITYPGDAHLNKFKYIG